MAELLRLNRYLAMAGVASRRQCDALIRQGRVVVNGEVVTELGTRVVPDQDEVTLDGRSVACPDEVWTLVLNKPRNVLVAARDTRGRATVMDLLGDAPGRVFPVGRLDYRSEGLLLFTNDGDLAYRLAHPRYKVEKVYDVEVDGRVAPGVADSLRRGVLLDDGPTQPARVRVLAKGQGRTRLAIALREGRKRQVRRMLGLFGLEVVRLVRVQFGSLELGELEPGTWRMLEPAEVAALREAAGLGAPAPEEDGA